jgi:hypothetical protein
MEQFKRFTPLAVGIGVGIILQLVLIVGECNDTPSGAVIAFSKSYFMLDPNMADYICEANQTVGGSGAVDHYLNGIVREAKKRGFTSGFMKNKLYHIRTHTIQTDDTSAEVQIHGKRRFAMNPLYAVVAEVFGFSQAQDVDHTLTVVRENGRWKVCGGLFNLPASI